MSISGLLANEGDMLLTQLQCLIGCHGHHSILCNPNSCIFGDNIFWHLVIPLNNFAFISNCLWMQGKSNKPPIPTRGVCGGGRVRIVVP